MITNALFQFLFPLAPTSPFLLPQEDTPEIREQVFPCYTLFKSFLESKKRLDEDLDLFTLAEEYEKQCCDHLTVLMSLKTGQPMDPKDVTTLPPRMETLLRSERNSWRIIRGLFEDRVKSAGKYSTLFFSFDFYLLTNAFHFIL